ncbi:MAG: hydantoinase/carbamoylase family amidase [Tannerellaceae bacterium]|jgi:N-carbamoyl-L-amino-acid hydrolase|nr:hydantoinase/carbamoylase family amidase [Tannerellaceae bacterium]
MDLRINRARLQKRLGELAGLGRNSRGGIDRSIGDAACLQARTWLIREAQSFGATVKIDAIANLWFQAGHTKTRPPITFGSHHDTVPNGGKYDGSLGVLLGLEVMQTVLEQSIVLSHPLQVVSFTAEEPNPYNLSTMGSRSVTGKLSGETLAGAVHAVTGEKLVDTIRRAGGDLAKLSDAQLKAGDMHAFIECHIEQGRCLYDRQLPVAVVSAITGIYRERIRTVGEANHAGTTLMHHRHDALLAAAEAALALERIVTAGNRNHVVGTVGQFAIEPNAANIIPGTAEFILELRTPDEAIKATLIGELEEALHEIAGRRGVSFDRAVLLDQSAVPLSPVVMDACYNAMNMAGLAPVTLVSMAGHDAAHMAGIAPTGMLFVQSIMGKSHCAEEETTIDDIETAANLLLHTTILLDKLDKIPDKP